MNERIRKLAVEADEYAEQTVHYYQGQFDGLTWEGKIKQTRDTKFAELIVEKCAGIIESQDVDPSFKLRMSWAVKKHFGVK